MFAFIAALHLQAHDRRAAPALRWVLVLPRPLDHRLRALSPLAIGIRTLTGQIEDENSGLQQTTGLVGTLVSGLFLTLIAIINLVILVGIVDVFRRMRHGDYDEAELEEHLNNRGFMNRILGRITRAIGHRPDRCNGGIYG